MEIHYQICCGGLIEDPVIPISGHADALAINQKPEECSSKHICKFYKMSLLLHIYFGGMCDGMYDS